MCHVVGAAVATDRVWAGGQQGASCRGQREGRLQGRGGQDGMAKCAEAACLFPAGRKPRCLQGLCYCQNLCRHVDLSMAIPATSGSGVSASPFAGYPPLLQRLASPAWCHPGFAPYWPLLRRLWHMAWKEAGCPEGPLPVFCFLPRGGGGRRAFRWLRVSRYLMVCPWRLRPQGLCLWVFLPWGARLMQGRMAQGKFPGMHPLVTFPCPLGTRCTGCPS